MLLAIMSCTNEESFDLKLPNDNKTVQTSDLIPESQAIAMAKEAVSRLMSADESAAQSRASGLVVKSVKLVGLQSRATEVSTQCYAVNFAEGGYALVSATALHPEVLAIGETGAFDPTTDRGDAYFLSLAEDYLAATPSSLDPEPWIPTDPVGMKVWHGDHWCYQTKFSGTTLQPFYLMKTTWSQNSPYNRFCFTIDGKQAVTGCGPIAAAQVMAYHKKPQSYAGQIYNWDEMLELSYVPNSKSDGVAHLCHEIGVASNAIYGTSATSTTVNEIFSALKRFGYNEARLETEYNEFSCLQELKANRPILIGGTDAIGISGHMWVIDGAYKTEESVTWINSDTNSLCSRTTITNNYFHCNWGWAGSKNDYYASNVFKPYDKNYSEIFGVIYVK